MSAGGKITLDSPIIDVSSNSVTHLIQDNAIQSYQLSSDTNNFISINTMNQSLRVNSNTVAISSSNITLGASDAIFINTPIIDSSKNDLIFKIKTESSNAMTLSDSLGTSLLSINTNIGPNFPSATTINTHLNLDVSDVNELGVTAGYNLMKISTNIIDLKGVANKHLISSLFVDNVELKGQPLSSIRMTATLYVDGPSVLASGESEGAVSGHNASTSKYALYVAGEDANNQIIGKLFVKGGLYLGESNGTVAPTLLSEEGLAKLSGTEDDGNSLKEKVVVTAACTHTECRMQSSRYIQTCTHTCTHAYLHTRTDM